MRTQDKSDTSRWYRVQMDSGPFSTGANEYELVRDVRDCIRRGVDFTVTWYDTWDEAHKGWAQRTQEQVDKILLDRNQRLGDAVKLANGAVGLSDVVLDKD